MDLESKGILKENSISNASFLISEGWQGCWGPLTLLKVVSLVLQPLQKPVQELLEAGPLHHTHKLQMDFA